MKYECILPLIEAYCGRQLYSERQHRSCMLEPAALWHRVRVSAWPAFAIRALLMVLVVATAQLSVTFGMSAAQVWELVWADEFDYQGLPDTSLWDYDVGGHGWGNGEAQYYTHARQKNARVDGTVLTIEAHKESFGGQEYTSARLITRGKADWTHGRIEVRAMLPSGRGTWPAIWMLPSTGRYGNGSWPDNGEIDIMEHVGYDPGHIHGSAHTNKYNHLLGNAQGGNIFVSDAETAFHDYSVSWTPTRIVFAIDGAPYYTYFNEGKGWVSWPFDQPFYLLLNIAVGGSWGGAQGIDDTIFPQELQVDYVRAYRYLAPPDVNITAPMALSAGDTLRIMATASDTDGTVAEVEVFQHDVSLQRFTGPPFVVDVANVHDGCYRLYATATDDLGWVTGSDTVALTVGGACGKAPYLVAPHPIPGRIEAEHFDLGGQNVGYLDLTQTNDGDGIRQAEGVEVFHNPSAPGYHALAVRHEWLAYTTRVKRSGYHNLFVHLLVPGSVAAFSLSVDGQEVATYDAPVMPGAWTVALVEDVEILEGVRDVVFKAEASMMQVNWIRFTYDSPLSTALLDLGHRDVLHPPYPNPAVSASVTLLHYELGWPGRASLEVFNVLGERVVTLADRYHSAGWHEAAFNGTGLAPGIYLCRLVTAHHTSDQVLMLSR